VDSISKINRKKKTRQVLRSQVLRLWEEESRKVGFIEDSFA
jgi:hypothetical protein